MRSSSPERRCVIAYLLAICLLAVSAAAFTSGHLHPGVKPDACSVCKATETPVVHAIATSGIRPPWPVAEYMQDTYDGVPLEIFATASRSRAPPSL